MTPVTLAIHSAAGRMGRRLVALSGQDAELRLVAALERAGHPDLGQDAGMVADGRALGVPLTTAWQTPPQAVIDFSLPEGAAAVLRRCLDDNVALVLATTGLDDELQRTIGAAAERIAVVWAPNMSLAVNLTMKLAEQAGRAARGQNADVEILERHHRFKEDAPSGTALKFGQILADAMGLTRHQHGREGQTGQRPRDEIGYHAIRTGDDPGQHTIVFGLLGETIELTVRASSRDCYALGALAAAKFVAGRAPGLYTMSDVLGALMARCDEGYLCEVCGQDVEQLCDSDLYLRYVIGLVDPETLHTTPERHIRCNPERAQFILDPEFPPVDAGEFGKQTLDPEFVRQRESLVTRGWRRLVELSGGAEGLSLLDYPLPECRPDSTGEPQ